MPVETINPESSMIAALSYDESRKTAIVTFAKGGAVWEYAPVSRTLWISWKAAPSKGGFFLQQIKYGEGVTAKKLEPKKEGQ